jgi:hypothetical protein
MESLAPFLQGSCIPCTMPVYPGAPPGLSQIPDMSPSGPGEFHPRPLTEPDVSLATYPARATLAGLPACHHHLRAPPVAGWPYGAVWVTCLLRSPGITLVPRYYKAVRP